MLQRFLLILLCSLAGATSGLCLGPPPTMESLIGERLEFRVRWGIITAARASLEVVDADDGRIHLRARARTATVAEAFYPVRARIDSTFRLPGVQVERYYQHAREGWGAKTQVDEVLFDLEAGISRQIRDGQPRRTLLVPTGVQDPLSCFFEYRTRDIPGDEDVLLDITDGNKLVIGVTSVLDREVVETPAGTFRTVRIEPKIEGIGGVFKKTPGARLFLWLTDDRWRRPVKMQSKVIVGHFTAELVDFTPPTGRTGLPRDR